MHITFSTTNDQNGEKTTTQGDDERSPQDTFCWDTQYSDLRVQTKAQQDVKMGWLHCYIGYIVLTVVLL